MPTGIMILRFIFSHPFYHVSILIITQNGGFVHSCYFKKEIEMLMEM
ncbi:hypothetical protein BRYFOR_08227 [Marvinbryantia formatexigens DSM 14469]|uniref:Uncharacterized protein n=1 Tax=Marvinbryantia formatexigens DSM 14469 TaxID=478749 RepID=C6LHW2_9FIRM|nr:hypothetical protein BRYFOR_08227 [Marvinbryantia formatexigens DSM 14469]